MHSPTERFPFSYFQKDNFHLYYDVLYSTQMEVVFLQEIIAKLTSKDDKYSYAIAEQIIAESLISDKWYEHFDSFAALLSHPKSLVRNRMIFILAANAHWDDENCFDSILDDYLAHITDEKPITARQCIKALRQIGMAKPQYIPKIITYFHNADLSKYKDSMRPLIKQDMAETESILTQYI